MNVAISIFMPVYNGSKYLARTLTSILAQTFKDFEVICVDDSSMDESLQILQSYAEQDARIKVFTKPNGGNVPKSWIFALPHFTGEYIFYSSLDDMMSTDLLENVYGKAKETRADIVVPDKAEFHGEGKIGPSKIGLHGNRQIELTGREAFLWSLKWEIHAYYAAMNFDLIVKYKGAKGTIIRLLFAHGDRLAQFAVSISLLFNAKHIST